MGEGDGAGVGAGVGEGEGVGIGVGVVVVAGVEPFGLDPEPQPARESKHAKRSEAVIVCNILVSR